MKASLGYVMLSLNPIRMPLVTHRFVLEVLVYMIHSCCPIPLDTTLHEFLTKVLRMEESLSPVRHSLSLELFERFQIVGCNYYDLLAVVSSIDSFSEEELELLISLSPSPQASLPVNLKTIRECIPRWTASKYHSAPIAKIVEEMQNLLTGSDSGITVFNSNLNPRDKRAVNDQYVLLISQDRRIFVDINRKTTISFTPN